MAIVQASYDVDNIEVTFGKKRYPVPTYWCSPNGSKRMTDSRTVLMTLTQSEAWFFWNMDMKKDPETNEVMFSRANCPKEKVNYYTQVVKNLVDKNMILRIKQNNYLINPNMTMPKFEHYEKVKNKWLSLGGK